MCMSLHRTGGDYDEVLLADAAEIMRRRIEGIVKPIDRWLDSLSIVKVRGVCVCA